MKGTSGIKKAVEDDGFKVGGLIPRA